MARFRQKKVQEAYQGYVADALRIITENTAHIGGGTYIKQRWAEVLNPKPQETRSPDEIKEYMKQKLNRIGGLQSE